MAVIDFRVRPPYKRFCHDWMFELEDKKDHKGLISNYRLRGLDLPKSLYNESGKPSIDTFLEEMDSAGITQCAVSVRKLPGLDNEDLKELIDDYPGKFIGLAGLQPNEDMEEALNDIDQYIIHSNATAAFMEPALDAHPWDVDDEKFYPVYEECQSEKIPIVFLFGGIYHKRQKNLDYDIYNPTRIEHLAVEFPKLHIILSHAAFPWTTMACGIALNYDNVFLSPDNYLINLPGGQDYIVAANYALQDKTIYGSCYPGNPLNFGIEQYKQVLREAVWDKIFYQNAKTALMLE